MFIRQNIRSVKCPFGKISLRRNVLEPVRTPAETVTSNVRDTEQSIRCDQQTEVFRNAG